MKRINRAGIALILAGIVLTAVYMYRYEYRDSYRKKEAMSDAGISDGIIMKKSKKKSCQKDSKNCNRGQDENIPMPYKNIDLAALHKKNGDVCGYIMIPDSIISYPVMYSPDDTYLHKDYHKDYSYHGSIYTRHRTDSYPLVLFGHNMRDGTMFASIKRYADASYRKKHRYAYLYTNKGWQIYKFDSFKIISPDYDDFRDDRMYLVTCQGKEDRFLTEWKPVGV